MHWLALVTDAFGGVGGIAQYNRDLFTAMAASRRIASLRILPRSAPGPVAPPEPLRQMPARGQLRFVASAVAAGFSSPVDAVFCGHFHFAPVASWIAKARGAKLIIQAHGIEVWRKPSNAWRAAIEASDVVLCVSRHTRRILLEWAVVTPERVLVLSNTASDEFTPGSGAGFRHRFGLAQKRVL